MWTHRLSPGLTRHCTAVQQNLGRQLPKPGQPTSPASPATGACLPIFFSSSSSMPLLCVVAVVVVVVVVSLSAGDVEASEDPPLGALTVTTPRASPTGTLGLSLLLLPAPFSPATPCGSAEFWGEGVPGPPTDMLALSAALATACCAEPGSRGPQDALVCEQQDASRRREGQRPLAAMYALGTSPNKARYTHLVDDVQHVLRPHVVVQAVCGHDDDVPWLQPHAVHVALKGSWCNSSTSLTEQSRSLINIVIWATHTFNKCSGTPPM